MSRVKKTVLLFFILGLVIAVGYWYLQTKVPKTQSISSWEDYLPKKRLSLLYVNTKKVRNLIFEESISSPSKMKSLYESMDSIPLIFPIPTKEIGNLLEHGVAIPDQLIIFELATSSTPIAVGLLPIYAKDKLSKRLNQGDYSILNSSVYYHENQKFGLVIDNNFCLVIMGDNLNPQMVLTNSTKILENKNQVKKDDILPQPLPNYYFQINHKSQILPWFNKLEGTNISFSLSNKNGNTSTHVVIEQDTTIAPPLLINVPSQTTTSISTLLHAKISVNAQDYPLSKILQNIEDSISHANVDKALKALQINRGDLDNYWNGHTEFTLRKPTINTTQAITYTYNDNFEKVKVITNHEEEVPDFNLILSVKDNSYDWLKSKQWLNTTNGIEEFVAYPFQKVYFKQNDQYAHYSATQNKAERPNENETAKSSLNFKAKIKPLFEAYPNLLEQKTTSILISNIEEVSFVQIRNNKPYEFNLEIKYTDKEQNGLLSLLQFLKDLEQNAKK